MAEGIVWNLEEFYQGPQDPDLDRDLQTLHQKAQEFAACCEGLFTPQGPDAPTLLSAIKAYESIHDLAMKPYAFAYLHHASQALDEDRGRLLQRIREIWSQISETVSFFFAADSGPSPGLLEGAGQSP